ncbi:MAG: hypothetical protein C0399_08120 [Syntrophus sp. (in: bacteria)]|nr:hypothetical protein [Syntrophus sp. (in: bacteria)]
MVEKGTGMIRLTIDGKEIQAEEGRTILEAARENGISIPTLCHHKNLLPIGSCRLCIVEIAGYEKPMASCTTNVVEGISVTTQSEKLFKMRQEYLKFLLIHHPLDCPICDAGGECKLQDLTFEHKVEKVDLTAERETKTAKPYATALIRYSEDRCVLCLRCVHACREISGRTVLALEGSGIEAHMAPVNVNDCISCGECLNVCPVGALTEQSSPLKSRKWQTERKTTTCPHCGFGCSLVLDVFEDRFITKILSDADNLPNKGSLCVMGRFGYDFANHDARVKTPAIRDNGTMRTCELTEAVETTAAALTRMTKEGKRSGFIVSPRATNEEITMVLQIARCFPMSVIGTTGQYHTGKILNSFRQMGIPYSYEYDNLSTCDLVVVAGADLLANNHLLANKVREAVKLNGAKVAVIDPSPTALTEIADVWLKTTPGTDTFLFNNIAKQLIAGKKYDTDAETITGFADFTAGLEKYGKQEALQQCGIDEKSLDRFTALFSKADTVAVIFGSGITAHDESMAALLNLCLLRGLQKKGLIMPTSLQSNAVGALSILTNPTSPRDIVENAGIGGLLIYEDDPFHYLNGVFTEEAMKKKSFVTVCDALPTYAFDYANITIPTGTFAEKEGTFVAEDGFVRKVERARGNASMGFEFLKMLLNKLCGGLYHSEQEALAGLYKKEVLSEDGSGKGRLFPRTEEIRFLISPAADAKPARPFTLVMRNIFLNHHLSDKVVYSKTGFLNNPAIAGNKLFISPEDATALTIAEGDTVTLESDFGTAQERASIKKGLKQGVVEYRMSKNRQNILKLAGGCEKHIPVTVKKG